MKVKVLNPKIIKALIEQMPEQAEQARNKYPKLKQWAVGQDYPTYRQLVELAKKFHVPFGYFFLEKLPVFQYPIPHYRTIQNGDFVPSAELLDTLKFAQRVQEWAKEILLEWGQMKLDFCGKFKHQLDVSAVVAELRNFFDVKEGWAKSQQSWIGALNYLTRKAEEKGIIVLINGVVGNNSHRKLNVDEFRGFVLYDDIAPVVFINNNDAVSAKIFTLVHEVVHILIGESASFDLRDLQSAENEIEKFCDACAAEFLVPKAEIEKNREKSIEELAKQFKVSQIVIARRLLDLGKIRKSEFYEFLKQSAMEKKVAKQGGGNFYDTAKSRLSRRFLSILKSAVENNTISYRDACLVTNLGAKTYFELTQRINEVSY